MCCTRLAGNTGRKKSLKIRHLRTITGSSSSLGCVFVAADAVAPRNTALGRHNVHSMYCAKHQLCPYAPVTAFPQCKQIK